MSAIEDGLYGLGRLDRLSYLDTPIHRIDPRAKVVTTFVYLVCVVSFDRYELLAMLPFLVFPVALVAEGDLPLGFLLRKLLTVAPFALLVGAFNPLLDTEVLVTIGTVGVSGGWVSYASIVMRFLLTTLAALVLVATTSFAGVCAALARMRVPDVFVTQLLFLYRYLFVLAEEAMRMVRARALRSFGPRGMGLAVYVQILGHLLLRTYARAQRIYRAMLARAFTGEVLTSARLRFNARDAVFATGWSGLFVFMRVVDVPRLIGGAVTGVFS